MKKYMLASILLAATLSLSGCSSEGIEVARGMGESIKWEAEGKKMFKDIDAHTQEEMHEFALYALEKRYGIEFELDTENDYYGHKNGHEDLPIILYGDAYPKGNKEDVCRYEIVEPNTFYDNYSMNKYKDKMKEYLQDDMKQYGVEGDAVAKKAPAPEILEDGLEVSDLLKDGLVTVYFDAYVPEDATQDEIIEKIRPWMDYCYTRNFNWYFELYQGQQLIFTLSDSDYGYKSSEDWSDETILESIKLTKWRSKDN